MLLSIIIPTYNEDITVVSLIQSLITLEKPETTQLEIIVVDGNNSTTLRIVENYLYSRVRTQAGGKTNTSYRDDRHISYIDNLGVRIIVCKSRAGRGIQLNTGTKYAQGDVLWFVHADSKVGEHSIFAIDQAINGGYALGCFTIYFFDSRSWILSLIAWGSTIRARSRMIFGDQGIFLTKKLFHALKGFPEIPIFEDGALSLRARKFLKKQSENQKRPVVVNEKLGTSGQTFQKIGVLSTFLLMQKVKRMYYGNIAIEEIAKTYTKRLHGT